MIKSMTSIYQYVVKVIIRDLHEVLVFLYYEINIVETT